MFREPPINIQEYFKKFEVSIWEEKMTLIANMLHDDSSKTSWTIELYCTFLQIVEIFWINSLVAVENELWENLFIQPKQLQKKISIALDDKNFSKFADYFLRYCVFGVVETNTIEDYEEKKKNYQRLLKEIAEVYNKDRELLNAYKHGYKVVAVGPSSLILNNIITKKFTAGIEYYGRKYEKELKVNRLVIHQLYFNWERIVQLSEFALNMLANTAMVKGALEGEKINLITLAILDPNEFRKYFGTARFQHKFHDITW